MKVAWPRDCIVYNNPGYTKVRAFLLKGLLEYFNGSASIHLVPAEHLKNKLLDDILEPFAEVHKIPPLPFTGHKLPN